MPPQGFGYQKWFEYEVRMLIPYISNGPLISWLYLCLQGDRTIRRGGACRPQALGRVCNGENDAAKPAAAPFRTHFIIFHIHARKRAAWGGTVSPKAVARHISMRRVAAARRVPCMPVTTIYRSLSGKW